MKELTKKMISDFKIMKLGYDFMGYDVEKKQDLSYHHLIIPKRNCKLAGLGEGFFYWNGAILNQSTSHDYLHLIENIDPEIFFLITSEMIDENIKGRLDIENLRKIRDLLLHFEKEHHETKNKNGKKLIKTDFIEKRINL